MKKAIIGLVIALLLGGGAVGGWMYHTAKVNEMREAGVDKLKASVDLAEYRDAEQEEVQKILTDSEAAINEAKDQESIDQIQKDASKGIEGIKTAIELDREDAIAKLQKDYPLKNYREDQQPQVDSGIDECEKKIAKCSTKAEIDKAVKDARTSLDEIKTDEQLTAEEEAARAAAAAAAAAKKNSSKKSNKKNNSSSEQCIGNDSSLLY